MKLYNTLTRKKQQFKPLHDKRIGVYSCGPTVYSFAHIGNLRSYIFADILHRALEYDGYKVKHIINITDVGHLVSDEDEGEDKIIRAARLQKKSAWEVARFFENQFKEDIKELNIIFPDKFVRATEHIKEQIELIKRLEKKGYTYKTKDGIYFNTSRFKDYGKLGGQKAGEKKAGARVKMGEKKNITDFALWKFSLPVGKNGKKRQMEWASPWGKGFPGWHIECSAMSRKYLGQPFDIHTGGIDHIPVHHTNEITQSEAAYEKPLAHFWLHNDFLTVDGGRMGKSEGNFIRLSEIKKKGFNPLAFRYFTLQANYRTKLNFTWNALTASQNALNKLWNEVRKIKPSSIKRKSAGCLKLEKKFEVALDDDLNTPECLAVVWELLKSGCKEGDKAHSLLKFDEILGLDIGRYMGKTEIIPEKIKKLAKERENARKKKDWKSADKIRMEIERQGYEVEDTDAGFKINKK